jgi:hypothetical protein
MLRRTIFLIHHDMSGKSNSLQSTAIKAKSSFENSTFLTIPCYTEIGLIYLFLCISYTKRLLNYHLIISQAPS